MIHGRNSRGSSRRIAEELSWVFFLNKHKREFLNICSQICKNISENSRKKEIFKESLNVCEENLPGTAWLKTNLCGNSCWNPWKNSGWISWKIPRRIPPEIPKNIFWEKLWWLFWRNFIRIFRKKNMKEYTCINFCSNLWRMILLGNLLKKCRIT